MNGDDVIVGNGGNDSLYGYSGNDTLITGSGNDSLNGGYGNDKLFAGAGNDNLYGEEGDDELYGEAGDDTLSGGNGNDYLDGGEGNDYLYGGNGDDILIGGKGNDYLSGDYGNDTYIFNLGDGVDTISDYDYYGTNKDKIVFGEGIKKEDIYFSYSGNNLKIKYSQNDEITISNQKNSNYSIEKIELKDGSFITNTQIDNALKSSENINDIWQNEKKTSDDYLKLMGDNIDLAKAISENTKTVDIANNSVDKIKIDFNEILDLDSVDLVIKGDSNDSIELFNHNNWAKSQTNNGNIQYSHNINSSIKIIIDKDISDIQEL